MRFTGRHATDHGLMDHLECQHCLQTIDVPKDSEHIPGMPCPRCQRKGSPTEGRK